MRWRFHLDFLLAKLNMLVRASYKTIIIPLRVSSPPPPFLLPFYVYSFCSIFIYFCCDHLLIPVAVINLKKHHLFANQGSHHSRLSVSARLEINHSRSTSSIYPSINSQFIYSSHDCKDRRLFLNAIISGIYKLALYIHISCKYADSSACSFRFMNAFFSCTVSVSARLGCILTMPYSKCGLETIESVDEM